MAEKRWRRRSPQETQAAFDEQWGFLRKSCADYDSGDEAEAKRLANALRQILYNKGKAPRAILDQLGAKDILFFDTARKVDRTNLLPTFGLVVAPFGTKDVKYIPPLDNVPLREGAWLIPFEYWWKKIVVCIPGSFGLSRKDLILLLANQDGGSHVDPELDEDYYRLAYENSLGMTVVSNGVALPLPHIATASVRQIAYEVMISLRQKLKMIPPDLPDRPMAPIQSVATDASTGETRTATVTPKRMCMCNSGLEYEECHAYRGRNVGRVIPPRTFECPDTGKQIMKRGNAG